MTRALMRNCPKCQKAFVKEHGCNKMSCPDCHTLSCYICRNIISGYDHFDQGPSHVARPDSKKCPLWDASEQQHTEEEVRKAAQEALQAYKQQHPNIAPEELKAIEVQVPQAKPAVAVAGPAHIYAPQALVQPPALPGMQQMFPVHPPPFQANFNFNLNFGMVPAPLEFVAPAARVPPAQTVAGRRRAGRRR